MTTTHDPLPAAIRDHRAQTGQSYRAIAAQAGVSAAALNNYALGKRTVTIETWLRLAAAIGCEVRLEPAAR